MSSGASARYARERRIWGGLPAQLPYQLSHLAAGEAAPGEEREQPPPPRFGRQPGQLPRAPLGQGAGCPITIQPLSGECLLHYALGEATLHPLGQQVANEARGTASPGGVHGGVMKREGPVVEQAPFGKALERGIDRRRRMLLAEQPPPQILTGVPTLPLAAQRGAPRGLDVRQLLEALQRRLGDLAADDERQQLQSGQSIADIARARGMDPDALADQLANSFVQAHQGQLRDMIRQGMDRSRPGPGGPRDQ